MCFGPIGPHAELSVQLTPEAEVASRLLNGPYDDITYLLGNIGCTGELIFVVDAGHLLDIVIVEEEP